MKLYKFRALSSCQDIRWIKEIICENKFYCSEFHNMNDPMEGVYSSNSDKITKKIFDEKNNKVICSFSNIWGFKNLAMWGYYANEFKGVAIEVEVDEEKVKAVQYKPNIEYIEQIEKLKEYEEIINSINKWEHEKEYRFITNKKDNENSYKVGNIKKVYFGNPYGNTKNQKDVLNKNKNLKEYLCIKEEIEEFLSKKKIDFVDVTVENGIVKCKEN